jgi:acylphosphatase
MAPNPSEDSNKPAAPAAARRFFVEGHVQGVFFREWAVGKAREMGLSGWVRNLSDGRVEVYAIGEAGLLDRFAAQLRKGSPASIVSDLQSEPAKVEAVNGFSQRQTA